MPGDLGGPVLQSVTNGVVFSALGLMSRARGNSRAKGWATRASDKIHGTSVAMNIEKSHYLMKCTGLICLFTLVLCGHSLAQAAPASSHAANCSPAVLDIDGNKIWMNEEGKGNITVVFEVGFGNDSSVWSQITPKIQAAGVQTFVYDRAGMGKSTINTSRPYSIDNDVYILRSALANCHIKGPIVMVGHSYGGAISLLAASEDPDIAGLVLIEAVVPNVWTPTEVENNLKMMRPQYDEIREKAPDLAKVSIPGRIYHRMVHGFSHPIAVGREWSTKVSHTVARRMSRTQPFSGLFKSPLFYWECGGPEESAAAENLGTSGFRRADPISRASVGSHSKDPF